LSHSAIAVDNLLSKLSLLKKEIQKIIIGQDQILDEILVALLAGGHCLLEGVPGLGENAYGKNIITGASSFV
jgi:MoxR-like ATPase